MIFFATIASGSDGNCTAVWDDNSLILIDAGITCKRVVNGLKELGKCPDDVKAIFISHEHIDHIKGCRVYLSKYPTEVFCTKETREYMLHNDAASVEQQFHIIDTDTVKVGELEITPFRTSHDSITCRGFRIERNGTALAIATDLGKTDEYVLSHFRGCKLAAIECNYDELMLKKGTKYSQGLKNRIASDYGHLSNSDCAAAVAVLAESGTKSFMLMHLSKENNTPNIAVCRCEAELEDRGLEELGCIIKAAPAEVCGEVYEVR